MKILISISAKQVGTLYHYTNKSALLKILRSGKLALSTGRAMTAEETHQGAKSYFASFTRSRYGGFHYKEGGVESSYSDTGVMVTIDGNALSEHEVVKPVDYWGNRGSVDSSMNSGKEVEERVVSNRPEIPILKCIKRVDLIQKGNAFTRQTYGFDKGKLEFIDNDRLPNLLGSIILQLKKNHIPYGFFNSMNDWARKQGEYSYTGPKKVQDTKYVEKVYVNDYKRLSLLLESLSNKRYEDLSTPAQDICDQMWRYPSDAGSVFETYINARRPATNTVIRTAAQKVARIMKRLNLNTVQEAGKFLADKSKAFKSKNI